MIELNLDNEINELEEYLTDYPDSNEEMYNQLERYQAINKILEEVAEITFGDSAKIDIYEDDEDTTMRVFTVDDVIDELNSISNQGHEAMMLLLSNFNSIDDFEKQKKEFLDKTIGE